MRCDLIAPHLLKSKKRPFFFEKLTPILLNYFYSHYVVRDLQITRFYKIILFTAYLLKSDDFCNAFN